MIKLALERSADTIKKELSYGRLRSFSYAPVYFISNSPYKQTGRGGDENDFTVHGYRSWTTRTPWLMSYTGMGRATVV